MGVLQDFERRLEGAVEGFFARAFRSGLQPIELAKALQRYLRDTQHVTASGVLVPNVFRFVVNPRDQERLDTYGASLRNELAEVAARTAEDHGWIQRGPARVTIVTDDDVRFGTYRLTGRVDAEVDGDRPAPSAAPAAAAPAGNPLRGDDLRPARLRIRTAGGSARTVALDGRRLVAGRAADNAIALDDPHVSRQHAAFTRRGDEWWVVDLGSTNGTEVNGTSALERPLRSGDRVTIGETLLEFEEG